MQVPQHEVECAGRQQQQEHRFLQRLPANGEQRAPTISGQRIGAVDAQPLCRLFSGQTGRLDISAQVTIKRL